MCKLICLMPTYNKEETLAKAIESVMMQKTDFKYKLFILDDCSTDGSNNIAQKYKEMYPDKIEIIRNKTNQKLLRTITKGYSLLKGVDYFCVLDADDWYTSDIKFQNAVSFLDKHEDFSMYMTNVNFLKNGMYTPMVSQIIQEHDFSLMDEKSGKGIFVQTSGVIYRNVYFKNGMIDTFSEAVQTEFGESYRSDGFRYGWYLHAGKAHYVNHLESVYNYNEEGIWSSLKEIEQHLLNAQLGIAFAHFFKDEEAFYLYQAQEFYEKAIYGLKEEQNLIEKNKDMIFRIYKSIYINKNYEVITEKIKKSFLEKIFSVKNSKWGKKKIITILGIEIKIKMNKIKKIYDI